MNTKSRLAIFFFLLIAAALTATVVTSNHESKTSTADNSSNPAASPVASQPGSLDGSTESVVKSVKTQPLEYPSDSIFETIDPSLVDNSILKPMVEDEYVNRFRVVKVNTDLLRTYMRGESAKQPLPISPFADINIVGEPYFAKEYHEGQRAGISTWGGRVQDDLDDSAMTMTIGSDGEAIIAIASKKFGIYNVDRLAGTPFHIIRDLAPVTEPPNPNGHNGIEVIVPTNGGDDR